MPTPGEFYSWLMSRVHDGGAKALRQLSDFARDESELLMKGPAMAAMLCWKEKGCETIVATAIANPTSKNLSSAFKLLSAVAAGGPIEPGLHFIHSDELPAAINASIADGKLRQPAHEYLMDLLQSLDNDDLLIPLGVAFTQLGMIGEHGASELIRAMSSRWLKVGPTSSKHMSHLFDLMQRTSLHSSNFSANIRKSWTRWLHKYGADQTFTARKSLILLFGEPITAT